MAPGQTLVEKIATTHATGLPDGKRVYAGEYITIVPRHVMTHDNTSAIMEKYQDMIGSTGEGRIHDPSQPVFAIDHDIQNTSSENLGKYARIEAFARANGIDFYPAGTGISHQVMVEYGYVIPGSMVVGSDSHSNLYGAAAALGTPVVRTDAASIWATGATWWQVPQVARVSLEGMLPPGVVGKDVIIALCGFFNQDEVLNMAVEFGGSGIPALSMDQRMSIANMTTEWGALAGVFPFDEVLREYLYGRADFLARRNEADARITRAEVDQWFAERLEPDPDAHYAIELTLDMSSVIPHVSGPDHVKIMRSLPDIEKEKVPIQKAYLLSCVNARLEDLAEAASVARGQTINPAVEFYVAAASSLIQAEAESEGHWQALLDCGARPLPPGCGTCIGLGAGTLRPGETAISATNRNFKGRMGSRDAQAYLASPAVVVASAIAGYICSPRQFEHSRPQGSVTVHGARPGDGIEVDIIEGFPPAMTGRGLYLPIDNLNTDGIYAGDMTYRDDVTVEEMQQAAMANYDPRFHEIAKEGDILVSGRNFGTGSSREQAATCLQARGITCVIAASFSETYKRNAFNNGFIVFESGMLSAAMKEAYVDAEEATIPCGDIVIDCARSEIRWNDGVYPCSPLSPVAQDLVVSGGAEGVIRRRLQ